MDSQRGDPSLAAQARRGRRLIELAQELTGEDDFRVWRSDCNAWIWSVAEGLEVHYGEDAAQALRSAAVARSALPGWRELLPVELERVREAVKVLKELLVGT